MFRKMIVITAVILLFQTCVWADSSAVYTVEKVDKYTVRVTVDLKEPSEGHVEVTGYSKINPDTRTVRVLYQKSAHKDKNTIDISLRSLVNKQSALRIVLADQEQTDYLPFKDIQGNESEIYIRHLHDAGLLDGYDDGTFKPGNTISRAEFFTMMVRAMGYPVVTEEDTTFTDIADHWGKQYILTAIQHGLVKGNDDGTIKPDDKVTIGQIALVIDRAFSLKTYDKDGVYANLPKHNHYAKESVKKMLDAGVLKTEDSTYKQFDIDRPAVRAECAMMISRAMVN